MLDMPDQSSNINETPSFQPSAEQLMRAQRLYRFNWLYFYTPLVLFALGGVSLVVWMVWATVFAPLEAIGTRRETVSAVADIIIIFATLPMILTCLIVPLLALVLATRQRERSGIERLQRLLWRVDNIALAMRDKTAAFTPRLTQFVITLNGWLAYLNRFYRQIKQIFLGRE